MGIGRNGLVGFSGNVHDSLFRVKLLSYDRSGKSTLLPERIEIAQARAGSFADSDQGENVEHLRISRIASAALDSNFLADAHRPRIRNLDLVELLLDHNSLPPMIVGVYERISDNLAHSLMYVRLIDAPVVLVKCKWSAYTARYLVVYPVEEIDDVSAPSRITGANPVSPSCRVCRLLAIVEIIVWQLMHDRHKVAKADKSGDVRMKDSIISSVHSAYLLQKLLV